MRKIKVLGVFGNVANAGQERANSDVYKLLANESGYSVLVLVNKRGFHWHLQPFFEKNNIPFKKITFPWGIYKMSSIRHILTWFIDIIINNLQFIYYYFKFNPDYIHIGNEYMYKTLILPLSICRAKIMFRLGDRPFRKHFFNRFYWKLMSWKVNTFVCDTNYILGLLKECGRKSGKDIVLYHPAPERISSRQKKITAPHDNIVFGYVGQIKKSKGVLLLVECACEICKQFSNAEFRFAGDVSQNKFFNERISPLLESLSDDVKNRISFLGHIEDIDSYYSSIDVHVAPTIAEEPYGLVLVEAKKNSKPSIILKSGGMVELVDHLENGFVCSSKDKTGLKEGIVYYLENSQKIKQHGENALNSIVNKGITYNNFREKWLSIYQ